MLCLRQTRRRVYLFLCCSAFTLVKHAMAFVSPATLLNKPEILLRSVRLHNFLNNNEVSKFSQHSISADSLQSRIVCRVSFWKKIFSGDSSDQIKPNSQPGSVENTDNPWQELADPNTGRPYFWNKQNGATTWERPSSMPQPTKAVSENKDPSPILPPNPKQFAFSKTQRTPSVGVCSAAGKSGGKLKANQDASIIQARLFKFCISIGRLLILFPDVDAGKRGQHVCSCGWTR